MLNEVSSPRKYWTEPPTLQRNREDSVQTLTKKDIFKFKSRSLTTEQKKSTSLVDPES